MHSTPPFRPINLQKCSLYPKLTSGNTLLPPPGFLKKKKRRILHSEKGNEYAYRRIYIHSCAHIVIPLTHIRAQPQPQNTPDTARLSKLCTNFGVPAVYRVMVWKVLLGMLEVFLPPQRMYFPLALVASCSSLYTVFSFYVCLYGLFLFLLSCSCATSCAIHTHMHGAFLSFVYALPLRRCTNYAWHRIFIRQSPAIHCEYSCMYYT